MQTVSRLEWARRNRDPWRLECPDGHTGLTLNSSKPVEVGKGQRESVRRTVYERNYRDYSGQVYCLQCQESHLYAYDKKVGEKIVLDADTQFVDW